MPRPERERHFWEVWEARKRNGQSVTQADANKLAGEYEIEPPTIEAYMTPGEQCHLAAEINARLAADAREQARNRRIL